MSLNFGLNVKKSKLKAKISLDDDDLQIVETETPQQVVEAQISRMEAKTNFIESKAEQEPNVYDYDSHFDEIQMGKLQRKRERDGDFGEGKKARYMQVLIKNAKERRVERDRIKDKRIEQENKELYGEVETFVTKSFRIQMEQEEKQRKLEAEREEAERKNKNVTGFYKGLLDQVEQQRTGPIILGDKSMAKAYLKSKPLDTNPNPLLNTKLNDEGEAIDKIKQLKGGLNIVRTPQPPKLTDPQKPNQTNLDMNSKWQKVAQAKRQSELLAKQKLQVEQQQLELEQAKEQKLLENISSKITQDKAALARERYLARKNASI